MNVRSLKCLSLLLSVAFGLSAVAQAGPADVRAKSQSSPVTVPFFADDGHGHPVSSVTQADFSILDNKNPPQTVVAIQRANELPLRLGILIDTSNSEKQSHLYKPGMEATSNFVNYMLKRAEDRAFIETFNEVSHATNFLGGDELSKFKIDMTPGGGTALYDAVYVACIARMKIDTTHPARRVLVILSDGGENQSHRTQDEAVAAAQATGTVIFAVSTNEERDGYQDNGRLKELADKAGGYAFLNLYGGDLPKVFSTISEQVGGMYFLTYIPVDSDQPKKYHSIELKPISDKKLKLRAPKGYYVSAEVK